MLKLALCVLVIGESTLQNLVHAGGHGHAHHVIIHVPYKIKTIHHTHTITKHVHHKDDGDKYDLLGYTVGHPIDLSGHEHGHAINGGSNTVALDAHNFEGNHEFSDAQELSDADWASGTSEHIKDSGYEGSSQAGIMANYDSHRSSYHKLDGPEFSKHIYTKRGDLFTH